MGYQLTDAQWKVTRALPTGAATVASTGIDLGHGARGDHLANHEVLVSAPTVTGGAGGELPDGQTLTYDLFHDTDPAFGGETLFMDNIITQTGAGGAGAAAATAQVRLPVDVKQHVRLKVTKSGANDASAKSATMELVF